MATILFMGIWVNPYWQKCESHVEFNSHKVPMTRCKSVAAILDIDHDNRLKILFWFLKTSYNLNFTTYIKTCLLWIKWFNMSSCYHMFIFLQCTSETAGAGMQGANDVSYNNEGSVCGVCVWESKWYTVMFTKWINLSWRMRYPNNKWKGNRRLRTCQNLLIWCSL